jgi:hypothetical protein
MNEQPEQKINKAKRLTQRSSHVACRLKMTNPNHYGTKPTYQGSQHINQTT